MLASALVLFIAFASFDLPGRWGTTAATSGVGLALGLLVVHQHRAPVRRKPTGPELLFYAGVSAGLIVVYVAFAIATAIASLKFDLPAQHTVAAAALALTTLLCANPTRRVFESIVRR
jgi:heme A synthase